MGTNYPPTTHHGSLDGQQCSSLLTDHLERYRWYFARGHVVSRRSYVHVTHVTANDNHYRISECTDQPHGTVHDFVKRGLLFHILGPDLTQSHSLKRFKNRQT